MAFKQSYSTKFLGNEIIFENAYISIYGIEGSKYNINLAVAFYDSQNKENTLEIKYYTFVPNITDNSVNFIRQGYAFLKSLPEFNNVIDILEEGQVAL